MTEPTLRRYVVRPHPWAWSVVLTASNGMLAIWSDYGRYVYHWSDWGPRDFRTFLLELDDGYLIRKLNTRNVLDGDRTRDAIRRDILEHRRERYYTRDFARREWDLLQRASFTHEIEAHEWYLETNIQDAAELIQYGADPQLVQFVQRLWPSIREAIQAELKAEGYDDHASAAQR
jgi:hypothetical protein